MSQNFKIPAEWQPHKSVWLAWPSHANLWLENLKPAQNEFVAFCKAIVDLDPQTGRTRGETIDLLVPNLAARAEAEAALRDLPIRIHMISFGDIWLRDTAPLFLSGYGGAQATARFQFNGWGGKYNLPDDPEVAKQIAQAAGLREFNYPLVLEGGSIELDGEGTCLTTRQCLLNSNRNPGMTAKQIESALRESLGIGKTLWLKEGLLNDHTDGHIDTIARFSAPGQVLCMEARDADDPNAAVLKQIGTDLEAMSDVNGRPLKVGRIVSPGKILNAEGEVMPASYLNFYIANTTVIVPTYGSIWDSVAVSEIAAFFPRHKTVGLSAKAILAGGGAFHCISQQQPL